MSRPARSILSDIELQRLRKETKKLCRKVAIAENLLQHQFGTSWTLDEYIRCDDAERLGQAKREKAFVSGIRRFSSAIKRVRKDSQ